MNALDQAIKIIENLNKRIAYLEDHLTPEEFDDYQDWLEESGLKRKN